MITRVRRQFLNFLVLLKKIIKVAFTNTSYNTLEGVNDILVIFFTTLIRTLYA